MGKDFIIKNVHQKNIWQCGSLWGSSRERGKLKEKRSMEEVKVFGALSLSSGVGRKPAGCTVEKVAEAAEESSQRIK